LIEEEKIAILIQEAPRLKDNVNAQQEVNRILDKPPDPETPAKKIVQLIQLFCSGYPLSMEIWLRWLTAVQQKHFEGKRGRVLEALRDIPKGNPDQTERFWINLFRILQKLPENPLRPLIRSEDLDAVIAARAPLFLEALEGFLLKHFKKREEAAYFRPYLEVLHKRGRLDDPKWIPSFSRMEESDLTLWSANFTSEVVILALFKEKVDRKGDQETVFTLYNKLKGKEQEEAAHFLGSADPSLFTEAIVNGYIDPYLQVPSFYPLFEQAAKGHFFQLYEYPGLKDFFSHHISLTCKEKGFYDLIVHKKTAFISGKECLESEISPITQTNLLRFIADLERCSEEFKRRLLDWSVDPDNTIEFTESLSIRLQIALRFLCFGDTSAQKGSDLEKSCNFLFHIFNNFFAPDLIDKFFLGLLLRSMGIPGSSEHEYLVSMLRDQSMQKATDYRSLDPLLKENQEKESIAMGVFLKRMEPSKREGFASKLLFAMNLMVGQLNSESPMFYNYLDFVATQFYWIVFEWDIFPPSQKLNALECFHQFCLWPGFNRAVSDEHMMRCRQLFLLFDQREGFNPSHLRKYQGDEIARFFYLQGFLSIILGLQIKVNFNKQATLLQTVYFEIFESCQQFLRKRDEEGIEKKSVILSRLMILLMPHPLHVFPEPYKSLRRDSVNQLVEFMKRFPEALVDDYFQCKLLFTALIPHAPNGLAEYKFETKFIKNFPRWLIGNLQGCSDQSKVPPHLLDELFLTFITYFFLISKPPVILDDERYWFKKRAISLFDSVVKAFKSEETYQSQFSGYAFLAAQLIAPTKKRHQLIKEIMGEAGLHFACAISNAIVCASWREDEKRKVLEVFLGTLGISGYLDNGRLLTALSPEGARLAGFNRHNLPFETVFNRKWFGLFDG
jgi:hypothetical protein